MGQKAHPYVLRIGIVKTWRSRWFAKSKDFAKLLSEDLKIREYIRKNTQDAAISSIEIERASDRIHAIIRTARPGIIIGRRGADIDRLRDELREITGKDIYIDIKEIKKPQADAQLIADNIAFQLEKRVAFRRAMKKSVQLAVSQGVEGIKIKCSGRLGGIELSRSESIKHGKIPLQTFRADIDYGFAEAHTTYGLIGIKVWICKGEVLAEKKPERKAEQEPQDTELDKQKQAQGKSASKQSKNKKK